ncbi:MAG: homocysteine S-methyltransferase family protein [Lachnospiraceae bacterium]|nr:homocysteine S-methyltransferase family protein [Lachnospiraceae bacterium]
MTSVFLEQLKNGHVLFDGGLGSLLQARGLPAGVLPETWNITHPEVLIQIHREYLEAGADVVTTNTFGANPFKFPEEKTEEDSYTLREIVTAAVANAKAAVRETGRGFVALDLGPTGKLLEPMGDLSFEDCVSAYAEVVRFGAEAGADFVLIETMSDLYELKAAVLAAKENGALPVIATVAFDASGKLLTGGTPKSVVALLEGLRADALGLNCGLGPDAMAAVAKELLTYASVPVIVQPNAGLPRSEEGRTVYDLGAEDFAAQMKEIIAMGAKGLGGCCGTTPAHIRALREVLQSSAGMSERSDSLRRDATLVTSFADAAEIGDEPIIIGERINPTGKKLLKQALRDEDMEYILNIGLKQQEQGAHLLDVNVGEPGIDEVAMLTRVVKELQSVTELPLQLDSADPEALARAMRIYNGKPMINSVNGKQESMDAVFPLVQKYGGVVVCLCLDEDGIPETADGRIAIAEKIIREAAKYGIEKKDLLIDALCMTVSTDERNAMVTLETVRRSREELGVKTILGVSNISFGLPLREVINAAFYTLAMENGLNAAIINPGSADMMRAYYAFRALKGFDPHLKAYIDACGGGLIAAAATRGAAPAGVNTVPATEAAPSSSEHAGGPLFHAISKGLKAEAVSAAKEALKEREALAIIDEDMMPALDAVGQGFEKGTVFLPQLMMSAEAAKAAFAIIREHLRRQEGEAASKGNIVLATVQGDIHDIGKNIVKVLLENYNYRVIDLGRDVPPEKVVEAALREQAPLVGLSALMTTTVPSMEKTIRLLREQAPEVRVMVGGAVLTKAYADAIGADFYAKDAMGGVTVAERIFAGEAAV